VEGIALTPPKVSADGKNLILSFPAPPTVSAQSTRLDSTARAVFLKPATFFLFSRELWHHLLMIFPWVRW